MAILKNIRTLGLCATMLSTALVGAQAKEIKVGVIYDQTGPFAGGGSVNASIGTQIAIDLINERGGIEGYKIVPINVDAQSKVEVAINAAERLINDDKVDLVMGVYSSAQCVPMAAKVDNAKGFMWANVCISSAVFKDRNLSRVFRAQVHSDQYGEASCKFLAEQSKATLGIAPADLKVAIIHEDGPYGSGVAKANAEACKKAGINVVLDEGYAVSATDLSPLIAKLRRARPDVILHTGYNPDIALFLRQAKEQGLKWKALIGHGAGYANIDRIRETAGKDVDYVMDVDPVAAQLLDPKTLAPGLGDVITEVQKRFKAKTGQDYAETNVWMGFNQSWILFTDVLPRAIKTYGGIDPDSLRKAALDADIPVGGTVQGYGVKFNPPGDSMAGQNARSFPVVIQHNPGGAKVVWPAEVKTADPVMPLPKGQTFAP
ncbi:ABC transporter substrate-binding protein [Aquabacter spiritensis]|uniref:Amino acid/amide ABC transporter substrate-binding protein (HAAT family) n=1 Tax=Aquabacter spiritensis TaxID=933073 RepID=A0A4R3LLM7_9HYPH|nr:ABC transporter substrate-binding protein [Aquabacter spiritensis]TCT00439.1 amino acid/amide ABC transporter substrate-binding protein (HAAT family) [Aquabacter spiritensis]